MINNFRDFAVNTLYNIERMKNNLTIIFYLLIEKTKKEYRNKNWLQEKLTF